MSFMYEETLLAHALRDYLRPLAGESEVKWIDLSLDAGEPVSALICALAICEEFAISLPPIFRDKIISLDCLTNEQVKLIDLQFEKIPTWWELAS